VQQENLPTLRGGFVTKIRAKTAVILLRPLPLRLVDRAPGLPQPQGVLQLSLRPVRAKFFSLRQQPSQILLMRLLLRFKARGKSP
jgi:hypothetical protein